MNIQNDKTDSHAFYRKDYTKLEGIFNAAVERMNQKKIIYYASDRLFSEDSRRQMIKDSYKTTAWAIPLSKEDIQTEIINLEKSNKIISLAPSETILKNESSLLSLLEITKTANETEIDSQSAYKIFQEAREKLKESNSTNFLALENESNTVISKPVNTNQSFTLLERFNALKEQKKLPQGKSDDSIEEYDDLLIENELFLDTLKEAEENLITNENIESIEDRNTTEGIGADQELEIEVQKENILEASFIQNALDYLKTNENLEQDQEQSDLSQEKISEELNLNSEIKTSEDLINEDETTINSEIKSSIFNTSNIEEEDQPDDLLIQIGEIFSTATKDNKDNINELLASIQEDNSYLNEEISKTTESESSRETIETYNKSIKDSSLENLTSEEISQEDDLNEPGTEDDIIKEDILEPEISQEETLELIPQENPDSSENDTNSLSELPNEKHKRRISFDNSSESSNERKEKTDSLFNEENEKDETYYSNKLNEVHKDYMATRLSFIVSLCLLGFYSVLMFRNFQGYDYVALVMAIVSIFLAWDLKTRPLFYTEVAFIAILAICMIYRYTQTGIFDGYTHLIWFLLLPLMAISSYMFITNRREYNLLLKKRFRQKSKQTI